MLPGKANSGLRKAAVEVNQRHHLLGSYAPRESELIQDQRVLDQANY